MESPSFILIERYLDSRGAEHKRKYAKIGLRFLKLFPGQFRISPQNRPFLFVWKRRQNNALIAKIRQICTSLNGHQMPLNRGCFQHIVYPVQDQKGCQNANMMVVFSDEHMKNNDRGKSGL
jgi:hypothetical protein